MGKDYATMTTAALQHRNCFLMGKLGRVRRGKLQAPPEKVEAWRREFDEVTEERLRRARRGEGGAKSPGHARVRVRAVCNLSPSPDAMGGRWCGGHPRPLRARRPLAA